MDEEIEREELNIALDETAGKELVVLPGGAVLPAPLRYVGAGEYIMGVPARDLSPSEAAQFLDQIETTHLATGRVLYVAAAE